MISAIIFQIRKRTILKDIEKLMKENKNQPDWHKKDLLKKQIVPKLGDIQKEYLRNAIIELALLLSLLTLLPKQ
jgi:hypothetical protein